MAEDQANRREPRKFVPNNIQPSVFVTFVYDNFDHNIESICNLTLHGTNGIIVQKCLECTNNDINTNPLVKNVLCRSFKPVSNELQPYIKTKARLDPVAIPIVDTGVNQLNGFFIQMQRSAMAEVLNLKETDLVLDHTIYCKAVEIVMNEKTLTLDHLSS